MKSRPDTHPQPFFFHHDIARLNYLAESVTLLATVWLGRTIQSSWLPDHAKEAYIAYLAHNYNRLPASALPQQVFLLAHRLDQQFTANNKPIAVADWYDQAQNLNILPELPNIQSERRFMRYLALRDLHEFTAAFFDSSAPDHLRPWVRQALMAALAQNQLKRAWENSITFWDAGPPPRPRTVVRAHIHGGILGNSSTASRSIH